MRQVARFLLDAVLPPGPCALCGRPSAAGPVSGLCRSCWRLRDRLVAPLCPKCGLPLPKTEVAESHLCGACLADPPPYEAHASVYSYSGPVRWLVLVYKEHGRYPIGRLLGNAVAREAVRRWPEVAFDGVVCVPTPFLRRMRRGFGASGLVAAAAAKKLSLPLVPGLRMKKTPRTQKGLTVAQRKANVRGAFAADGCVKGKRLLLVDDVTTTGATLLAAASALQRASAEVYTVTFAATLRRDMDLYGAGERLVTRD